MAVEKSMTPSPLEADDDVGQVEVEIVNPDADICRAPAGALQISLAM